MNQLSSFVKFLSEKLHNGELLEEWDSSLAGKGHEYDLDEGDVTEVAAFCYRLSGFIEKNYRKL